KNPFNDTSGIFPNMAFYAGIISGDGNGNFNPQGTLTRQEMCKIITSVLGAANVLGVYTPTENVFKNTTDADQIAPWAKDYVAFMLDNDLMAGYDGAFRPLDKVSREEAAIIAYRCFVKYAKEINGTLSSAIVPWNDAAGNQVYSLVKKVKTPSGTIVSLRDADNKDYTNNPGNVENIDKTDEIKNDEIASLPTGSQGYAPSGTPLQSPNADGIYKLKTYSETLATGEASEKEERVFGAGNGKYTTKEEADAHIVDTTVPVWKMQPDGTLYESTQTFKINAALEQDIQAIFKEIFESPQKPPIKDTSAYAWRSPMAGGSLSDHNFGTAIDINYNENYCVYKSGTTVGSYYDPGVSVYSMPQTGVIIQTFAKYGWLWGGNAWVSGTKDHMHFSYLGK
ncbi:MAG: S-layer homology domain-containing protein, partial [Oscillospiraceae bacterium]